MKTITLWEPWASLIAAGLKEYETRGWRTHYRGPVAIHASKTKRGLRAASPELLEYCTGLELQFGSVVAIAELDQVVATGLEGARTVEVSAEEELAGDWSEGRWAWKLVRVAPLAMPLYVRGRQGLWTLDDELAARAVQQTRRTS